MAVEYNKYNNSRIYKISSSLTDKIYIGSTCQALSQRMAGHMKDYKCYMNGKSNYVSSYDIIKLGDAYISLIQEYNLNNRQQLFIKEYEIMKLNINIIVNKQFTGRTDSEYRQDNKEIIAKRDKKYNQDNKAMLAIKDKQKYLNNKQSILEKAKQTFLCDCGTILTIITKSRHIKTTKHLQLINKLYLDELTYYIL